MRGERRLITLHRPIPQGLVNVILRTVQQGYRTAVLRDRTIWIARSDEPELVRVYNQDGEPDDIVPVTRTGRFLTDADIRQMAEDAEREHYRTEPMTPVEDLEYE